MVNCLAYALLTKYYISLSLSVLRGNLAKSTQEIVNIRIPLTAFIIKSMRTDDPVGNLYQLCIPEEAHAARN